MIENDRIERAMLEGYARGIKDGYGDGYRDGWEMAERNRREEAPSRRFMWMGAGIFFATVYLLALTHAWRLW